MTKDTVIEPPELPAGGWGSAGAVGRAVYQAEAPLRVLKALSHQNKPDGFACVSCSWAKPAKPHVFEFCENGAKATAWELTSKRATPDFFERHTLSELRNWDNLELESVGRLTHPLRYDQATDRYLEVDWLEAFEAIGAHLKTLDPKSVVFYASGRASLETTYMYQLLARMYGSNNLPDSSNMCHESTSVGLKKSIGVGVGTVQLEDFEHTDCFLFFGQNVGTNSPRMLHLLQEARQRNVPIVTFNPIKEAGLVRFTNPQSAAEMLSGTETPISTQYHQVKIGGDIAAITGICKAVLEADDLSVSAGTQRVIDVEFIIEHTHGFEAFESFVRATPWNAIEDESGLSRSDLRAAASEYTKARAVMAIYGMGITQHRRGVENVTMICNLLLMRGNIGKPGAGVCPVRGHSNVQGQRTVGMTEKPELAPLDQLARQFQFEPPRDKGMNTVETCSNVLKGSVAAFVGLGGNFLRAIPETEMMEQAWAHIPLTVHIATKLNRTHVVHGQSSYILPCLGRIEIDRQASGEQSVAMEDSTGCMHGSRGRAEPASETLLSEPAIVAGLAQACLTQGTVPWNDWVGDYSLVRDAIEGTYPDIFRDFNARMWIPGGFHRPLPACHRIWDTPTKRANFLVPDGLIEDPDMERATGPILRLMTLRSDDQFNTTIYGLSDRFRGIYHSRRVILISSADIGRLNLSPGDLVTVRTVARDQVRREVEGLRIVPYDIPQGCAAGYFPECNPLVPLWHHAKESMVPAAKSIPIEIVAASQNP